MRTIVDYKDLSRITATARVHLGSHETLGKRFPPMKTSGAAQECSGKKRHYFVDTVVDDQFGTKK